MADLCGYIGMTNFVNELSIIFNKMGVLRKAPYLASVFYP